MEQRDGAAVPGAAPARGAVAPLAAERSRPTAPAMMWLPHTLPVHVGASTGALPLAVVDAIPGDLEGPRAGAHGCATFLGLVSLSSKAAGFCDTFASAGGSACVTCSGSCDTEPKRDDSQSYSSAAYSHPKLPAECC